MNRRMMWGTAIFTLVLTVASGGCSGTKRGPGQDSADTGNDNQTHRPPAKTYHLAMKYPKGLYETITSVQQRARRTVDDGPETNMELSQTVWISSTVDDPDPLGHTIMFSRITRVKQSQVQGDGVNRFDSADPETFKNDPVAEAMARVFKTVRLKMYFDPSWKLVEITGMDEAWEELSRQAKTEQEAQSIQKIKRDLGDDTFERMVIPGREYMPAKPVAVGETWEVTDLKIPLPVPGQMRMTATCTLLSVKPFQNDHLADIEIRFHATGTGKSEDKEVPVEISSVEMDGKGQLKLLVDAGFVIEQTMDVGGDTEITIARTVGRQFVKTHFNMTTLLQGKRVETPPASAPAAQP